MSASRTGRAGGRKVLGGLTAGLLAAVTLLAGPAFGQTPQFSLAGGPSLPSERTAIALSVVGTVAAVASVYSRSDYAFLACLTVGPSLGFFYGGCWGRGLLTATLRLAGTVAAVAVSFANDGSDAAGYLWLGAMIGTAILDIATVRGTVRRHNERARARNGFQVDIAPFAMPKGAGLRVRLGF